MFLVAEQVQPGLRKKVRGLLRPPGLAFTSVPGPLITSCSGFSLPSPFPPTLPCPCSLLGSSPFPGAQEEGWALGRVTVHEV